jgi:hypothetical protein
LITPDMVIQELQRLTTEAAKAPQAIFEAEKRLAEAEFEVERGFSLAFMNAEGTVADRTALAKLETGQLRLDADIARAELNRVRNKAKQLADAGVLNATIGRQVELLFRTGH